jgi:hypothetical protein
MSLLLLFNQPPTAPTVAAGSVLLSRQPQPRIIYMGENRLKDDELVMMLLAKYLEVEESDYAD